MPGRLHSNRLSLSSYMHCKTCHIDNNATCTLNMDDPLAGTTMFSVKAVLNSSDALQPMFLTVDDICTGCNEFVQYQQFLVSLTSAITLASDPIATHPIATTDNTGWPLPDHLSQLQRPQEKQISNNRSSSLLRPPAPPPPPDGDAELALKLFELNSPRKLRSTLNGAAVSPTPKAAKVLMCHLAQAQGLIACNVGGRCR